MHDIRRAVSRFVVALVFVAALAACAHKPPDPVFKDDLAQVTATVEAVDLQERLVALRDPQGLVVVGVPRDVRNLDQVQVGDHLVVSYYQAIAAQMKKHGERNDGFEDAIVEARAPEGARPARAIGNSVATTVKIESVDTSFNTVTFRRADGMVRTLAIESPQGRRFIRKLSPGDEVDVVYTEAVAVEVVPER